MAEPWEPSPAEVKSVIPQRLQGRPFTDISVPTRTQVMGLIGEIAGEIQQRVGAEIPPESYDDARRAAKYLTASRLEVMLYPEQQRGDNSPSATFKGAGEGYLDALQSEIIGTEVELSERTRNPISNFPTSWPANPEVVEPSLTIKGF
jgi:hypothetical protein